MSAAGAAVSQEFRAPAATADAVCFTARAGTVFGPSDAGPGVRESFVQICSRAGINLAYPAELPSLCCGTPWRSKGMTAGYAEMARRVLPGLWQASRLGALPVVCDATSCSEGLRQMLETQLSVAGGGRYACLRIVDAVAFVEEHVFAEAFTDSEDVVDGAAPNLLLHPDGLQQFFSGGCGGRCRVSDSARQLGLLWLCRRPRHAASRPNRPPASNLPNWPLAGSMRSPRATGPANSG